MSGWLAFLVVSGCSVDQLGAGGGVQLVDEAIDTGVQPQFAARLELGCEAVPFLRGEVQLHVVPGLADTSGAVRVRSSLLGIPALISVQWPTEGALRVIAAAGPELLIERVSTEIDGFDDRATTSLLGAIHGQAGVETRLGALALRLVGFVRTSDYAIYGATVFASFVL